MGYGQSHEGNEGHEGHAGNEEEGSKQDRQGQNGEVSCLPWHQGQDLICRDQEERGSWQKGLRQHQGLDYCRAEGQEGFGREGLRRSKEGISSLQESQGALPVNIREHAEASAQGVGMSTPLERSCFGWYVC